ncbi:hypothetical protein C8R42DRAFT_679761 [Lentinula raphanica]|nr:hypothetical protein C8R42DRAFT_679761 [Lentinula raphanica]
MQPPLFGMGSYLKIFLVLILGLFTFVHTAPAPMNTPTNSTRSVESNLKKVYTVARCCARKAKSQFEDVGA